MLVVEGALQTAFQLSQRLLAGLAAASFISGFMGGHYRAPPVLLFATFAASVSGIALLWGRLPSRSFNRLLIACVLLAFVGSTFRLLVSDQVAVTAVTVVTVPIGTAAAAAIAALGFQAQQPGATARRRARLGVAVVGVVLLAALRWHEEVWSHLDSAMLAVALAMGVIQIFVPRSRPPVF